MLQSIAIKNILLIDDLFLEFDKGLCVITGETGAGKSILLDCMLLALGDKADVSMIRRGAASGMVTAEFAVSDSHQSNELLESIGIEKADYIAIRRIINSEGRSKAYINDHAVSLSTLKSMGEKLVEFHGQHTQRELNQQSEQLHILDSYGKLEPDLLEVRSLYKKWREAEKAVKSARQELENSAKERDYLEYVYKDIKSLSPNPGEESELAVQRTSYQLREKVSDTLKNALHELTMPKQMDSAIVSALRSLAKAPADTIEMLNPIINHLENACADVTEAIQKLETMLNSSEVSLNVDQIEERLFAIRAMSRKYNIPADDLLDYAQQIQQKLENLDSSEVYLNSLIKEEVVRSKEYLEKANQLSAQRQQVAVSLSNRVMQELEFLKMEKTRFEVRVDSSAESNYTENGIDCVSFLASTNPGMPLAPISKIASGGELSRFMLALKVALSEVKMVPTMIFDEIDTGISGQVADAVGARLQLLGRISQVMVVTHQPQVAARGSCHLYLYKSDDGESTTTKAKKLSLSERTEEVARMVSGAEISTEAIAAASKLLEKAA